MTPRWLFVVLLLWAVLLAPAAAAPGCVAPPESVEVAMASSVHCAHGDAAGPHAPTKSMSCGGVCLALEACTARLTVVRHGYRVVPAILVARFPEGVLVEGDTPPPRLS